MSKNHLVKSKYKCAPMIIQNFLINIANCVVFSMFTHSRPEKSIKKFLKRKISHKPAWSNSFKSFSSWYFSKEWPHGITSFSPESWLKIDSFSDYMKKRKWKSRFLDSKRVLKYLRRARCSQWQFCLCTETRSPGIGQ